MIVKRQWTVRCRGCKKKFQIYEYEGLEGGRYASHWCNQLLDYMRKHRRHTRLYDPKV